MCENETNPLEQSQNNKNRSTTATSVMAIDHHEKERSMIQDNLSETFTSVMAIDHEEERSLIQEHLNETSTSSYTSISDKSVKPRRRRSRRLSRSKVIKFSRPLVTSVKEIPTLDSDDATNFFYSESDIEKFHAEVESEKCP